MIILKVNKEGPYKKDIFRAPGHQASMKSLIHFLQASIVVDDFCTSSNRSLIMFSYP